MKHRSELGMGSLFFHPIDLEYSILYQISLQTTDNMLCCAVELIGRERVAYMRIEGGGAFTRRPPPSLIMRGQRRETLNVSNRAIT